LEETKICAQKTLAGSMPKFLRAKIVALNWYILIQKSFVPGKNRNAQSKPRFFLPGIIIFLSEYNW
jgi:hypothetical protein